MDRYLRFNPEFDDKIPNFIFSCKLINKNGKIIGLRFIDRRADNQTMLDIPIKTLFEKSVSNDAICEGVKTLIHKNAIKIFHFFRGSKIPLSFKKGFETNDFILNDDFSYVSPLNITTSIYLPRCVLRYNATVFCDIVSENLAKSMYILYQTDFLKRFGIYHIEHIRFLNNKNNITIWMKSKNIQKFSIIPSSFDRSLTEFCKKYDINKSDITLKLNKRRELLVLNIPINTKLPDFMGVGIIPYFKEYQISKECGYHYFGINKDTGTLTIIPDGGENLFNIEKQKNATVITKDSKKFVDAISDTPINIMYDCLLKNPGEIYVYISFTPQLECGIIQNLENILEEYLKSPEMDIFQTICGNIKTNDISFKWINSKIYCITAYEYDADINAFGTSSITEIIATIKSVYEKHFENTGMYANAYSYVKDNTFVFSIGVAI